MSTRVYTRKFDWDEARRLRSEGFPVHQIALRLGVSDNAVYSATDPDARLRMIALRCRLQTSGVCTGCGAPCSHRPGHADRCRLCWADSVTTTVRDDTLRCASCEEWKPDDAFPWYAENVRHANVRRRGRRQHCRACDNRKRVERRRQNQWRPCERCGTRCSGRDPRHGPGPDLCIDCYRAGRSAA